MLNRLSHPGVLFIKYWLYRGAWVAQLVGHPTSAQVMISRFVSLSPHRTLCWQLRAWSLLQILYLPLSLPFLPSLTLWLKNINVKTKKKQTLFFATWSPNWEFELWLGFSLTERVGKTPEAQGQGQLWRPHLMKIMHLQENSHKHNAGCRSASPWIWTPNFSLSINLTKVQCELATDQSTIQLESVLNQSTLSQPTLN